MNQASFLPRLLGDYLSDIVALMHEKYGLDEEVAMRRFVFSETYRMLSNPALEMWEFCPDVIMEMWECEQITGNPRNSVYLRSE